jgi:hypothetical protein
MVECLVKNGAKIATERLKDFGKGTALFNTDCEQGNEHIVFHLVEQGAIQGPFLNHDPH